MSKNAKTLLLQICQEFDDTIYSGIGLDPLIAYTVNLLDDNGIPTSFEYVVVAAYRMFPKKFGLAGFTEYPDSARINRALLHLTPRYKNWIFGNGSKGYFLNERGKEEAAKAKEQLLSGRPSVKKVISQPRSMYDREATRIRSSSAFRKYKGEKQGEIQKWEVYDALAVFSYTPASELRKRISNLITLAKDAEDQEIVVFLEKIIHDFPSIFQPRVDEDRVRR